MAQNLVGTAFFRINGEQVTLAGEMRLMPQSKSRTALVGMDGTVAYQVDFKSPMLECSIRDRPDFDLTTLEDMEDVTITVEMANGTVWEFSNAAYTGDGELDVREGTYTVRFNSSRARRIL